MKRTHDHIEKTEEKVEETPQKEEEKKEESKEIVAGETTNELFVGNLSFKATDDDIGEFFSNIGTVINVKLLKNKEGESKGMAFVKLSNKEECDEALKLDGKEFQDRKLKVNYSGNSKKVSDCSVFVSNIPFSSNKNEIIKFFEGDGQIDSVNMPIRSDGVIRGFAHIIFQDSESAKKALLKNGNEFNGRKLVVDKSGIKGAGSEKGRSGVKERPTKRKYKENPIKKLRM